MICSAAAHAKCPRCAYQASIKHGGDKRTAPDGKSTANQCRCTAGYGTFGPPFSHAVDFPHKDDARRSYCAGLTRESAETTR